MIDPGTVPVLGPPTASAGQARAYARRRGAGRVEEVDRFVAELWRLGGEAGYDPAVVFAQFCDETGVGTSAAWRTRLNPGGLGITDGADAGIAFRDGTEAARAMLVHLSAYVRGYDPAFWRFIPLDPRFLAPLTQGMGGSVRTLADLGNGRWATNPRYAEQIAGHLAALRAESASRQVGESGRDDGWASGGTMLGGGGLIDGGPTSGSGSSGHLAASPPRRLVDPPPGIVWVGTENWHERPGGRPPVAIVFHVTDDLSLANVRQHFRNPASRASAHFVIDRDGTIEQFVPTARAAWTNGDAAGWRRDVPWLAEAIGRVQAGDGNLNDWTIGIEHVGKPGLAFPEAQIARSIALARYLLARYPTIVPNRGHLLRHADINGVSRAYCPGPTFPLARIIRALGGDPERLA